MNAIYPSSISALNLYCLSEISLYCPVSALLDSVFTPIGHAIGEEAQVVLDSIKITVNVCVICLSIDRSSAGVIGRLFPLMKYLVAAEFVIKPESIS